MSSISRPSSKHCRAWSDRESIPQRNKKRKVSTFVNGFELQRLIYIWQDQLIKLAVKDYRAWRRSGQIKYLIRPLYIHSPTCEIIIEKGKIIFKKDLINADLLIDGINIPESKMK